MSNYLCKNIQKCLDQKYDHKLHTMICTWKYADECVFCYTGKNSIWQEELNKVEQCPQRQDSLTSQLKDLWTIANRFGLYDAVDYVREGINKK